MQVWGTWLMACVLHCIPVCRVSDAGVRHLVDGPCSAKLRELNLTNCIRVGDMAMVNIHKRSLTCFCLLPNLHALCRNGALLDLHSTLQGELCNIADGTSLQCCSHLTGQCCWWHLIMALQFLFTLNCAVLLVLPYHSIVHTSLVLNCSQKTAQWHRCYRISVIYTWLHCCRCHLITVPTVHTWLQYCRCYLVTVLFTPDYNVASATLLQYCSHLTVMLQVSLHYSSVHTSLSNIAGVTSLQCCSYLTLQCCRGHLITVVFIHDPVILQVSPHYRVVHTWPCNVVGVTSLQYY